MTKFFWRVLGVIAIVIVAGLALWGSWTYHARQWQAQDDAARIRQLMEERQ